MSDAKSCKCHTKTLVTILLIVQAVLLLVGFGVVQYPHSREHERELTTADLKIIEINRLHLVENASHVPAEMIQKNLKDSVASSSQAEAENVQRKLKKRFLEGKQKGHRVTVTRGTETSKALSISETRNTSSSNFSHRPNVTHVAPGSSSSRNRSISGISVSKNSTAVSTNDTYPHWLKRLQSLSSNRTHFPVANNLAEWFPINATWPSLVNIRSVSTEPVKVFSKYYFSLHNKNSSRKCLKEGTTIRTTSTNSTVCHCRTEWHGSHCSIPDSVWYSSATNYIGDMTLRTKPRKVITSLAFNMEFDLLEARIHDLWDVVDLFIVFESNYTLYGDRKPLRLLDKLLNGYLKEYHSKIYYMYLGKFPSEAKQDGWYAEEYERTFIGKEGMKHIQGLRLDDLFIYTDADEIPSHESILFLKTHDGYPEPFGFSLRWSVFGFFWKQYSRTDITTGCSIRMFRYIYSNSAHKLRTKPPESVQSDMLKNFLAQGGKLFRWVIGDGGFGYAGWHCSWCLSSELIRVKLVSAINADFPRWGSYPAKLDLRYIKKLVATGMWFDDLTRFDEFVTNATDESFAPDYMTKHWDRFKYILDIKEIV